LLLRAAANALLFLFFDIYLFPYLFRRFVIGFLEIPDCVYQIVTVFSFSFRRLWLSSFRISTNSTTAMQIWTFCWEHCFGCSIIINRYFKSFSSSSVVNSSMVEELLWMIWRRPLSYLLKLWLKVSKQTNANK
jgi:hypothetical protein